VTTWPARIALDVDAAKLVDRLCSLALRGLPRMYRAELDEFAFTRARAREGAGLTLRGTSTRYAAIVALGAHGLAEPQQRQVLGGRTAAEFVALLVGRLPQVTNLGDVALITWAAAQSAPPLLAPALSRLREVDEPARPRYVVEASWVLAALVAARNSADVEAHLAAARERLLCAPQPGSALFPHATAAGLLPWYRAHVACYADQVYPIQALARLHASGDDPAALRAATRCANRICDLQGAGGQWWWHYDARTGDVVEGYPVYTVHQHAMGPMALLDLAAAGGPDYRGPIERGLRWIVNPPELAGPAGTARTGGLAGGAEPMVHDDDGVTWRKVYRGDPRKVVRAVQGLTTRAVPRMHLPGLDRVYRPSEVDRECRPYELGWLLFAWLGRDAAAEARAEAVTAGGSPAEQPGAR